MEKRLIVLVLLMLVADGFLRCTSPMSFVRRQQLRMTGITLSPTSPAAPAQRKGEKVVGPIQWETRNVAVEVPSIESVEAKTRKSEHTALSRLFCRKSGGYPDFEIKNDIYTLLWASSVKALKEKSG